MQRWSIACPLYPNHPVDCSWCRHTGFVQIYLVRDVDETLSKMVDQDLFDRLEEYLDNHSDVNDGDDGPVANTAMSLLDDLQRWRKKPV